MDHEEVVKVVTSYCKKYECWRYIKNSSIKEHFSANIPRTPFIPVPSRGILGLAEGKLKIFGIQHQPLDLISQRIRSSELDSCSSSLRNPAAECNMLPTMPRLNWIRCNETDSFQPHRESSVGFQEESTVSNNRNQNFNSYTSSSNVDSVYMKENLSMSEISRSKNQFLQALGLSRKQVKVNFNYKLASNIRSHKVDESMVKVKDSTGKRLSRKRSCKKIRNIIEFKRLLKSAEGNPKSFPAILMNKKTKFLGSLSLAPRQICSRKMLSKFKEEMHKEKVIKRRSWYMGHKVLRDRNKIMKKMPHHKKPEHLSYMKSPKNTSRCNFILPLDNIKSGRKFNGRENRAFYTNSKANVLQLKSNEAKNYLVEFKSKDHTNSDLKAIEKRNNPMKDKGERFSLRNQVYLNESLANPPDLSVQEQPKLCWKDMYKNTTQDPAMSNEKQSKNVQKRINVENISDLAFKNANDSSLKTYSTSNSNLTIPQSQFSFINPALIPITPVVPHTSLSNNFPLIVRPMIRTLTKTLNETRPNSANNSAVWAYLENGRVNILNQKGNYKPETYLQPKPLPKNTGEFTGNKLGKNGTNGILIEPYRVLEPKIKISSGVEMQNITAGTSSTDSDLQKNVYFGITGNAIENSFASSTYEVSLPKDVDMEMKKLKKWIQRMMLNIIPCICTFDRDVEILKRDLLSELNYGLNMIKEIRKVVQETVRM